MRYARRHPAEIQRKALAIVRVISCIVMMNGMLSIAFTVGATDVEPYPFLSDLMPQIMHRGIVTIVAGCIWAVGIYLENYRKK